MKLPEKISFLDIKSISNDNRFDLNTLSGYNSLKQSISKTGIIEPLLIFKKDDGLILIDGFKRLKISRSIGLKTIPALILSDSVPITEIIQLRCFSLIHEDNDLNVLQKISLYVLLENETQNPNELERRLVQLNLPKNPNQLKKIKKLLKWPASAKSYINKYNASYKQIRFLLDQPAEVLSNLITLADKLSIRLVEFLTIYDLLDETALNNNQSITNLINSRDIQEILKNGDLNRNQKLQRFKDLLFKLRFPTVSSYQQNIKQKIKSLDFPDNFKILYDKNLERPGVTIQINIKNSTEMTELLQKLNDKNNLSALQEILNLL
jgi:ParB family chromosome partitioning protein